MNAIEQTTWKLAVLIGVLLLAVAVFKFFSGDGLADKALSIAIGFVGLVTLRHGKAYRNLVKNG